MTIVEIRKITHTKIRNLHDNSISVFDQDILEIQFKNGQTRKIAMFMEKDITDIVYLEVITTRKTKTVVLMHDILEDEIPW